MLFRSPLRVPPSDDRSSERFSLTHCAVVAKVHHAWRALICRVARARLQASVPSGSSESNLRDTGPRGSQASSRRRAPSCVQDGSWTRIMSRLGAEDIRNHSGRRSALLPSHERLRRPRQQPHQREGREVPGRVPPRDYVQQPCPELLNRRTPRARRTLILVPGRLTRSGRARTLHVQPRPALAVQQERHQTSQARSGGKGEVCRAIAKTIPGSKAVPDSLHGSSTAARLLPPTAKSTLSRARALQFTDIAPPPSRRQRFRKPPLRRAKRESAGLRGSASWI